MAKPHPHIVYHASPKDDLHKTGIDPTAEPTVTKGKSGWNYLGSHDYVHNQYLKYAPPNTYHIYKINTSGLEADDTKLAGEQQRYGHKIHHERVKRVGSVSTHKAKEQEHPDAKGYLDWYNKMAKGKGD